MNYLLILMASSWIYASLRRNLVLGFALAAALMVTLPSLLRIEMGGSLPEVTVHRIILLMLVTQWLGSAARSAPPPPFFGFLGAVAVTQLVSTVLSKTPASSIKDYLSFLIETVLFYRLAYSIMWAEWSTIVRVLYATVMGLGVLAAVVVLERYAPVSVLATLFSGLPNDSYGAQATYPHRILFGYAMAMGVPLAMSLIDITREYRPRRRLWVSICLMAAACYFSTSRGPWMGLVLGVLIIGLIGGKAQRNRCFAIALLAAATCLARPGVWETVANKYIATFSPGTHKASSYQYRYRLWHVAFSEISKSPERTLFGYGGLSTEEMDLGHYFEAQTGGTTAKLGYTSWDNRFACDLIEFGVVGFVVRVILFLGIVGRLVVAWRVGDETKRCLMAGVLGAASIYVFAQTNVDMFSIQLKFLFWLTAAAGFALPSRVESPSEANGLALERGGEAQGFAPASMVAR